MRDLNFSVASETLGDDFPDSSLDGWAQTTEWGKQQGKKLLIRAHFWDGEDRYDGPMRDIEVYWKRLDRFLGGLESRGALKDLVGISLAEENVHYAGRPAVLTELYDRTKKKYDVSVWQWWSPYTALPSDGGWIPADGWIIDPYFTPNPSFRNYVRKYLIAGKPVIVMPWAATSLGAKPMSEVQWRANNDQLGVAVEFNLPAAFYWCYGTGCHFGGDRGEPKTEIDRINHWVWDYIERVRALPADYNGLKSADEGEGRTIEIGPTSDLEKLVYEDDFSGQKCIDDAWMAGFRDLVMDGKTLSVRGLSGRKADATLTYHFAGDFAARYPKVSLAAITRKLCGGRVGVALSADGKIWPCRTAFTGDGRKDLVLSSAADERFALVREFWVKIRLSGQPAGQSEPAAGIGDLRIEADLVPPADRTVRLKPVPDDRSRLFYEEVHPNQSGVINKVRIEAEHR